jgi:Ca-activated chloride channel family protein
MHLNTTLEVELVAVETADDVAVLLEITAPAAPPAAAPGAGSSHFALDGDAAGAALAEEVDGLEQTAQAVSLAIRPRDAVSGFTLWNELPISGLPDGVMVELGDFYAGERRRILLGFEVPALPGLGAAAICELELRWVDLATMTEPVARLPINVNVVPGDVAARRMPDATVRDELTFHRELTPQDEPRAPGAR